jgi:hypothetical protein
MEEPTPFPNQDKIWHKKELTWDSYIPPPHLEFALLSNTTQVCEVQASLHNLSITKNYHGVVVGVALMFLGVTCPSFFVIST